MDITTGFFYLFAALMLLAALRVVTTTNPVHAALYLVLAFTQAAGLWLLLGAEFLAITLIVVYIGAVMVLFLFVVMMLDIRIDQGKRIFWKNFPLAFALGLVVAAEVIGVVFTGFGSSEGMVGAAVGLDAKAGLADLAQYSNTKELGKLMYTQYLYPIEIASSILLVAMVAAIALTLRGRKDTRTAPVSTQLQARARDRLLIVKMESEAIMPSAPAAPPAPVEPEVAAASDKTKAESTPTGEKKA